MPSRLAVRLRDHRYPILIGQGLAASVAAEVTRQRRAGRAVALLVDATVARRHAPWLRRAFAGVPRLALPGREGSKSLAGLGRVLDFLAARRLDRRSVLWVVGGGCLGDLGGFAAATYLRGIECQQVPTTLLAMVDSSVGGKTGINLRAGKNLAGAFHQPGGVWLDLGFLRTLPPREFAAGCAEIIKYGLLGDAALYRRLARRPLAPHSADLAATIRRCCELKVGIVGRDERELNPHGGRMLLNLGHTFGHAIERVAGYGVYLHGEAVAVGLAGAARLSRRLGGLTVADVAGIEATLSAHGLPVRLRARMHSAALLRAMATDKKARAGRLRFIVLRQMGRAATRADIAPAIIAAVWRELGAR